MSAETEVEKISENQNIHNMVKYNQPVGRLRDRAPSLLAGRFELERRRYTFLNFDTNFDARLEP